MRPVRNEYNVGYFRHSFNLSPNGFDEHKIGAEM